MSTLEIFDPYYFESVGADNGTVTWSEDRLMAILGYDDRVVFRKAVRKAMKASMALNYEPPTEFIFVDGAYKFTRVACFLIAMSCDVRKPAVAGLQSYLALIADSLLNHLAHAENVDRVVIRDEMTDGMKSLAKTAKHHGVIRFDCFMNAGYRGMYNMSLSELGKLKGLRPGEKLLDRMDRTELAANLFRVTQTDQKIKDNDVRGQQALEDTAFGVGETVREAMYKINETRPEDLPLAPHIKDTKKTLKSAGKRLKQLSTPNARRQLVRKAAEEETPEVFKDNDGYTEEPDDGSVWDRMM